MLRYAHQSLKLDKNKNRCYQDLANGFGPFGYIQPHAYGNHPP